MELLHRAFTSPYHGKAVDAFCEYPEWINEAFSSTTTPKYYSKFCLIIQSLGTSKSHLLLELHMKGIIILYMNLQLPSNITSVTHQSYPPQDVLPATLLTENLGTEANYSAQCCTFFMAIFKTICEYMSTRLESGSLEDVLKQWNNSMCNLLSDNHGHFFVRLMTTHNDKQLEEHEKKVTTSMLGFKDMITAYLTMRNSLDVLFNSGEVHKPKLVIALDEAHSLSMVTPYKYHPLTILCRAISLYSGGAARVRHDAVWVIFSSTTSKVANFAALWPYLFMDGQLIFPPYSQLRWDQMADPLNGITATDMAQAGHIIGFG
ncbi:hypothetical protein PISMIDRAFT_107593 [Pisolithus microcarpus 441]|uniref:Uncharacterized protein n=1 Tax=Pisolithus microcarpus 441 TaxID=765257 RepID=A0A0C9ZAB4_9AGAM|nr:hypothetical protein PISMIDRAFT_107593 [Pisolithus microcarpus 441]